VEGVHGWVEFVLTQRSRKCQAEGKMSSVVVTVLEAVEFSSPISEYGVEGVLRVNHSGSMAVNSHW